MIFIWLAKTWFRLKRKSVELTLSFAEFMTIYSGDKYMGLSEYEIILSSAIGSLTNPEKLKNN